jgi:hypothetical protein
MAKLYVPKEGAGRDAVQFTDLEEYYEEVESDDRWPIRAFLEFEGCDVIIIRLAEADFMGQQMVEVTLGIYDAFFGWQGWHFHLNPPEIGSEEELLAAVEKAAVSLRAVLQTDYEGERPHLLRWEPRHWMRDYFSSDIGARL